MDNEHKALRSLRFKTSTICTWAFTLLVGLIFTIRSCDGCDGCSDDSSESTSVAVAPEGTDSTIPPPPGAGTYAMGPFDPTPDETSCPNDKYVLRKGSCFLKKCEKKGQTEFPKGFSNAEVGQYSIEYYARRDQHGCARTNLERTKLIVVRMKSYVKHILPKLQEAKGTKYIYHEKLGVWFPERRYNRFKKAIEAKGRRIEDEEKVFLCDVGEGPLEGFNCYDENAERLWLSTTPAEQFMAANQAYSGNYKPSTCGRRAAHQVTIYVRTYYAKYVGKKGKAGEDISRFAKEPDNIDYTDWWEWSGHKAISSGAAPGGFGPHEMGLSCDVAQLAMNYVGRGWNKRRNARKNASQTLKKHGFEEGCGIPNLDPCDAWHIGYGLKSASYGSVLKCKIKAVATCR